jgi:hypothetical protein
MSMDAPSPQPDPRDLFEGIEEGIASLGRVADPRVLSDTRALVRSVLDLHAAGLARILDLVASAAPGAVPSLAGDDLVSSLLILHGLHPVRLEERVRTELRRVLPPGWSAEIVGSAAPALRVALTRVGDPSHRASAERVQAIAQQAIERVAPDADGVELVGMLEGDFPTGFVPVSRLRDRGPRPGGA